tara:strand:+ start:359 stop:967 length:609 start_codon:yes stop_codon:yes gene_type:complete
MKNEANYEELKHWAQYFPSDETKLSQFITRHGEPIGLRLDFKITTLMELKRSCVIVSKLNAALQKYAYQTEGDVIIRVMLAREQFKNAKHDLKFVDDKSIKDRAEQKTAAQAYHLRAKAFNEMRVRENARLALEALANQESMNEAREKQEQEQWSRPVKHGDKVKSKSVIDLGDVTLGVLPAVKKTSKIVELANKKRLSASR